MNKFKKIILNNGIPLYLYIDSSMKSVYVSYNLNYGSSGEWFKFNNNGKDYNVLPGYAHYLEHLLGEHSKFGDIYRLFTKRGQKANALTRMNETTYYFSGIIDVEKSLEELIISIETPVFNQKDVDATRHAIEEEATSRLDEAKNKLHGLLERNLYGGFELYDKSLSAIGNRQTTKQITMEGLYDCYNAFYTDDRKYFIIGGNVDEKRIVDLINNTYAKLPQHKSHLILRDIDYDSIRNKSEIINGDLDIPKVGLAMKFKKTTSISLRELYYVLYLIRNSIIKSSEFSSLEKKDVFDSYVFSYLTNVDDYINFSFAVASKNKDIFIDSLMNLLSKRQITKKEYELAKKGLIAVELRKMENKYQHLKGFANCIYRTEDYSECDFYKSIDYNRFMEILSELDFSNYTVGEVKRLKK